MKMTRSEVKKALGMSTDVELAKVFGIGRWAVGQWPANKPIPLLRQYQLRAMYPALFGSVAEQPTKRAA
jgi:hypothetical protein